MRHSIRFSLLVLLAAGATPVAAQTATVLPVADSAGLAANRNNYMRLYAAGDAAGIAALFAEDATLDMFGAPRMKGRSSIEAGLRAAFGIQKPVSVEIVPVGINAVSAAMASEIGTFHQTDQVNGKTVHSWGRYVTAIARDSSAAWRLQYLMVFPDSTRTDK